MSFEKILNILYKFRKQILILLIFIVAIILRGYDAGNKYPYGWDQVDNSWVAKNIIVNHDFPLVGMVAKQNTGFYIGPGYYYFITFFYWLTNLNPIASQYIALVTSCFTFFIIFFVVYKFFSFKVALVACLLNSFTYFGVSFDSVQWPVAFLPSISILFFYFLYKIFCGEEKNIIWLAVALGAAFNTHFTAVFFPIIILLSLPFFPRNKKMLIYALFSIPMFLIWILPNFIYQLKDSSQLGNMSNYINTFYHGFHLRRFFQLTSDGLIQFDYYLFFGWLKWLKFLILPIFFTFFLKEKASKAKIKFLYLVLLFFLVPWIGFSLYKGEISDYYFSINRFIALIIASYLLSKVLSLKNKIINLVSIIFLIYYIYQNFYMIVRYRDEGSLNERMKKVTIKMQKNEQVGFYQGVPESYLYYYLMRNKGAEVYK